MKNPIRLILHQQQQLSVKCGPRVRGPHAPPGCNKMAAAHLTDNRSAQLQQIWRWTLYGGSRWSIIHTACLQQEIPAVNNWLLRRVTEMPRMKWSLLNTWDWNAKYSFLVFSRFTLLFLLCTKERRREKLTSEPSEPRVIHSQATRWYLSKVSRFCELRCECSSHSAPLFCCSLSDYSAVTGFLSRLKWSCLAIKISQPSNSYQPALLLGWDPSPPQIRRGQVGGRNTVGLSVYLPSPSDVQIHQDARVSEWILGFSRERAEIAEFIPARPGYISDNAVTLGLSCNFLEDEARCDRWHSWWKSCRGRGHVALPSNLRRDRSERGHEEGPAATSTFPFLALFAKKKTKNDCEARQENLGSKTQV